MDHSTKRTHIRHRGRVLFTCSHGECEDHKIWDYQTCWQHMSNEEQEVIRERILNEIRKQNDLQGNVLTGADLSGFDFTGIDLSGALLGTCNLKNSKLVEANLKKAFFGGADLTNADLSRANLDGAVFSGARLKNVKLLAYSISFGRTPINLDMECFSDYTSNQRPHINEDGPRYAQATYRALKRYYIAEGQYDDASWAAFSERFMQEKDFWEQGRYFEWLGTAFFGWLSGYGEKPMRPVLASLTIIILYSFLYSMLSLLHAPSQPVDVTWFDSLYFSAATFCTLSFSDVVPISNLWARLVATSEAFIGLFMWGLYIFTLTNRYVAR